MNVSILIVGITVIAVLWLNSRKDNWIRKILDWFPAILFAYVIPATITHSLSLDLSGDYLHVISTDWIIPITILTVMSALSIPQLRIVGAKPILLFVSGSIAIATLPVVLVLLAGTLRESSYELYLEQEYWKGLVPIVGGWIGGSTSQLVLKEIVNTNESLFLSILVLDNILVNIWTILMFQFIKRSDAFNHYFEISAEVPDLVPDEFEGLERSKPSWVITIGSLLLVTTVVVLVVPDFLWRVLSLSVVGLLLGNFVRQWNHTLVLRAGGVLIIFVMAILGLRLKFNNLSLPAELVSLVIVWLISHFFFMLLIARLLKVHMAWVPIASMANLGGISTAPAVTAAYNEEWMPHAILLAILSMVTGTLWGMFTIYLFGLLSAAVPFQ